MFAEIGLGTDKRRAQLMPADGVLHVEDTDYALRKSKPGIWQNRPVQIGELHGTNVEVLAAPASRRRANVWAKGQSS